MSQKTFILMPDKSNTPNPGTDDSIPEYIALSHLTEAGQGRVGEVFLRMQQHNRKLPSRSFRKLLKEKRTAAFPTGGAVLTIKHPFIYEIGDSPDISYIKIEYIEGDARDPCSDLWPG